MRWPFTGRDQQFAAARAALQRPDRQGVLLTGDAGVGKTRLAREVLAVADARGQATAWAVATRSATSISFAALAHLMPPHDPAAPTQVDLLQAACRAIAERGGNGRLVLGIDDAHRLDDASAALVHLLGTTTSCFVVLTVRAGEPMPDAIDQLARDPHVERIEVGNLSRDDTDQLIRSALGGPVDAMTLQELWRLSHGNPLLAHEVVLGALDSETLVVADGLWRHTGELAASPRLEQVVESRLATLTAPERDVLEVLAVGDTLSPAILDQVADPAHTEQLERRGLIEITEDGLRRQARLTHPVHAEVLSAALPRTRVRTICRLLADAMESTGVERREDLLRLTLWRLESDQPVHPDLLARAARRAHAAFDQHLSERLARAAVGAHGGFEAQLALGKALAGQHRTDDAEEVLVDSETAAETDDELARAALARAANLGYGAGEHEEALAILQRAGKEIDEPDWRDEVAASQAALLADSGDFPACIAVAEQVAERPATGDRALLATLTISTLAQTLTGRTCDALAGIERGLELAPTLREELPLAETQLRLNRVYALTLHGQLHRAEDLARDGHRRSVEAGTADLAAAWAVALGYVLLERGRPSAANRQLVEAVAALRERDPFGLAAGSLVLQAYGEALLGRANAARDLLTEHDERFGGSLHRFSAWAARARCWRAAQEGDVSAAIGAALHGAAFGDETGPIAWGAAALHDVVRLGKPEAVSDELEAIAVGVDGDLVPAMTAHAHALAEANPQGLDNVAVTFSDLGADLLAAEAAAQAAHAYANRGDPVRARGARSWADSLARRCQGALTPALGGGPPRLTPREREVARLAASGLASREIAERLGIAVRTVDNHLHQAYGKLRVSGREELAGVL